MEVLLAIGILLACLIVLGQLAAVGRQHAEDAEQLTAAQLFCRTKLNEIVAGVELAASRSRSPIEHLPGWSYEVTIQPLDREDLVSVQVTVARDTRNAGRVSDAATGKRFTLVRWMHAFALTGEAESAIDWSPDVFLDLE
jgi:hypothetical protein